MRFRWVSSSVLLFLAATTFASDDPLFSRMLGQWNASGVRHYFVSDRKIALSAEVSSEIDARGRLVSTNHWTEVADPGQPGAIKSYDRIYWIRASARVPGEYELGMVDPADSENDNRVTARGVLSSEGFLVVQQVPSQPPLIVRSLTRFGTDANGAPTCDTVESIYLGDRQTSEATISYIKKH